MNTRDQAPAVLPAWTPPEVSAATFTFRFASSLLDEFVLSHSFDDVLRELVQNEYDAGGTQMSVNFGIDALEVSGSGKPIDADGWKRLSVMLGIGNILSDSQQVPRKTNGIGSKNQGLRSLFLFGDQIYVRSGGKQTVLDVRQGTLPHPLPDPSTARIRGVRIRVPYRTRTQGRLEPFTIERECELIDRIATELASTLIKLANPGRKRGLTRVSVSSERCGRRLEWRQSVSLVVVRGLKGRLLRRRSRTRDNKVEQPVRRQVIEELEFQRVLHIPAEFRQRDIPTYFVLPAHRIRLALSFRMHGKRIDRNLPGRYFYPLGARDGATGIALSVCAPFEMNENRSDLVAPDASSWNHWLLNQAIAAVQELLIDDWFVRFGADAYLALFHSKPSSDMLLAQALHEHLSGAACWPTRNRQTHQPMQPVFAKASDLVVPDVKALDGILGKQRYLDDHLERSATLHEVLHACGAPRFTVNSLVRLRSIGKDSKVIKTRVKQGEEANYHYTKFPARLKSLETQRTLAVALDAVERRLSPENKTDLRSTPTTLAADGGLASCETLQAIGPEIEQISPVPHSQRLHPVLLRSKVLVKLAQRANPGVWVKDTAARATEGTISEQEREALYRYIIKHGTQLNREVRRALKSAPVLRDQHDSWIAPGRIIIPTVKDVDQLQAALHLPHPDYAYDSALAKVLFFRKKIESEDLIAYAHIVAQEPQRAAAFERFLQRNNRRITEQVARQLKPIAFLTSSRDVLATPATLYLPNDINKVCLGDSVAYPAGRAIKLYERLGCQSQPQSHDIVSSLEQLRGQGRPPARPEVLYPALVQALRTEKQKVTTHEFDPLLWTGRGYHSPHDVLLGAKHRVIFQDAVPISEATGALAQAYQQLGAESEPQLHHWLTLLDWHDQRVRFTGQMSTQEQKQALRWVYWHIPHGVLTSIPHDRRWLLGRDGHLYSKKDIAQHRLLLNDDPDMADAIAQQTPGISFFETPGDQRLLRLAQALRIMRLTKVRQLVDIEVGAFSPPPRELKTEQLLDLFGKQDLASAMYDLVRHRYDTQIDSSITTLARLRSKLSTIREVVFSKDIRRRYRISGNLVEVRTEAAIKDNQLILMPIDTYHTAWQLIAQALAELFIAGAEQQRTLADAICILLMCKRAHEIAMFMRRQGILWAPDQPTQEEENIDQKVFEQLAERLSQSASFSDINPAPLGEEAGKGQSESTRATAEEQDNGTQPPAPPPAQTRTGTPPASLPPELAPLPPIENVRPQVVPPSENWSPTTAGSSGQGSSSGRTGTGSGGPRINERRESEIGQRGEELVYRHEQERIRQLGLPAERVKWVSSDNPNADHNIVSVDDDGGDLWIEVKATTGRDGRFEWSRAEFELARHKRQRYLIWRVYEADTETPTLREFRDPIALFSSASIDLDVGTLIVKVEPLS